MNEARITSAEPALSRRPFAVASLLWILVTVAALASVCLAKGRGGLDAILQEGAYSDVYVTMMSVAVCWLLGGAVLGLLATRRINAQNLLNVACFLGVMLLYLNILRERIYYGDMEDYVSAACKLRDGLPLNTSYLYPPLWATILQWMLPMGTRFIFCVCWLLNIASLGIFYFLLQGSLRKYGFSARLAALTTFVFMAVNVPILRTLCYGQINLHVMNFILISLLCYPRMPFVSALALSLAVHLKASPLLLVLAFVLNKDLRWLAWFSLCALAVAGLTVAVNGCSPYHDFLANAQHIYGANRMAFRENSIDSFFRVLSSFTIINPARMMLFIGGSKAALTLIALIVTGLCVKRKSFYAGAGREGALCNSLPVLLVFMVIASPLVWEHHPVLLALSYLVILRNLSTPSEWLLYGSAYFLEFMMPAFDLFPWSYGRLLSALIWLGLAWSLSGKPHPSKMFSQANEWLEGLRPLSRC